MMNIEQVSMKVREQRIIPLFYHDDFDICSGVCKSLYEAGIRCIEFTNRGYHALEHFGKLVKERDNEMKDLLLAIGTIRTADQATRYIETGADLLISPVFDNGVSSVASAYEKLWIPGCMTPTEIHVAHSAGLKLLKLFPGNVLGPGFVEAVRPVFPGIDYIVTGGVETSEESLSGWFKSGAVGVGLGSKLISKEVLSTGNFAQLKLKTKSLLDIVRKF